MKSLLLLFFYLYKLIFSCLFFLLLDTKKSDTHTHSYILSKKLREAQKARSLVWLLFSGISQCRIDKKKGRKHGEPKIVADLNRSKKKFLSTTHTLKK